MFQAMLNQCEILFMELCPKSHQEVSCRKVSSSNLTNNIFFIYDFLFLEKLPKIEPLSYKVRCDFPMVI